MQQDTGTVFVSEYHDVKRYDPEQIKAALQEGPVSVLLDGGSTDFQHYTSGILDDIKCGSNLDHAVLVVGYGKDADTNQEFFIIRNSWTAAWGEEGYIRLAAVTGGGICGMNQEPIIPSAR